MLPCVCSTFKIYKKRAEINYSFLTIWFYIYIYYKLCAICCTLLSGEDMGNIYSHVLLARRAHRVARKDLKILSCPFMIADEWRVLVDCRWTGWVLPCTCTGFCSQGSWVYLRPLLSQTPTGKDVWCICVIHILLSQLLLLWHIKFLYMMKLGNVQIIVSLGHVILISFKRGCFALTTPLRPLSQNQASSIIKVHSMK